MSIGVIIPAAGQGSRMDAGVNKQFLRLGDRPVLAHTLGLFAPHPKIQEILLLGHQEELESFHQLVEEHSNPKRVRIEAGGEERCHTVWKGLQLLQTEYVLIHDGARPLLPLCLLDKILEEVKRWGAVTLALRLVDTVKRVSGDMVIGTLLREDLRVVQTPQAFSYESIYQAYEKGMKEGFQGTDDVSYLERMGSVIQCIPGSRENIKITISEDLLWGEMILRERRRREREG